jgi:hypothetical protein
MDLNRQGLSTVRLRLSRSLGLRASTALVVLGGLGLGLMALAVAIALLGVQVLFDGQTGLAFVVSLAGLCVLYAAITVLAWLYVPECLPEGVSLPQGSDTSLWLLITRVGRRFGSPRIDSVWITGDMNAAVVQRPQWGLLGPMRTHLLLGLPLLHSVSTRQLAAILAHEFGHLVLQRQGLDAWSCHARAWWFRVVDRIVDEMPLSSAVIDSLSSRAVIDSLRLAHIEEFEADDAAARVVGARLVSEALVEVALKERFLADDYWAKIMAQSALRPTPSMRPYREMGHGMAAGFRRPESVGITCAAEMCCSDDAVTSMHPSLSDRLLALGAISVAVRADERSAADAHLGARARMELARALDHAWWGAIRRDWRVLYKRACRR